jgi:hypothetical protein
MIMFRLSNEIILTFINFKIWYLIFTYKNINIFSTCDVFFWCLFNVPQGFPILFPNDM